MTSALKHVFIGLGRMGVLQARLARRAGDEVIFGIDTLEKARQFFDSEFHCPVAPSIELSLDALRRADVVWVTVTDAQIETVAHQLGDRLQRDTIVFHTSGACSSRLLTDRLSNDAASIHPLAACPPVTTCDEECARRYEGCCHVIEGDERARDLAAQLVERIHGQRVCIDVDKKALYHAAAVFASNYPVTLVNAAQNMFVDCGFDAATAREATCRLLESALRSLKENSPRDALTGPVKRHDAPTIQMHQDALSRFDHNTASLYDALLDATKNMVDWHT